VQCAAVTRRPPHGSGGGVLVGAGWVFRGGVTNVVATVVVRGLVRVAPPANAALQAIGAPWREVALALVQLNFLISYPMREAQLRPKGILPDDASVGFKFEWQREK
jgi:hypothetical protein